MNNDANPNANPNDAGENPAADEENINSPDEQVSDGSGAGDTVRDAAGTGQRKKTGGYFSLKGMSRSIKDYWTNASVNKKIFIIVCAAVILLLIIAVTVALNIGRYALLHTNVEAQEAGQMINILRTENIPVKYNPTFGSISVKENDVARAAMALAVSGYSQKGAMVYEPVANSGMFRTDADIKQEDKLNLQNWLSAAINTLSPVENAYVTVTPADNSNAVLSRDYETAKATVIVHLREGERLSSKQVVGIETLLLNGVPSIAREDIAVLDGNGVLLNVPADDDTTTTTLYELKVKFEREYEDQTNLKAFRVLERFFAPDAVVVESNVTASFDKWIEESKNFIGANTDPETGESRGVITAEAIDRYVSSGGDISAWGAAGTNLNIEDPSYYESMADPEEGPYSDEFHRTQEYLVDYVTKQLQHDTPEIRNLSLATSINVEELDSDMLDTLIFALATATGIRDIAWGQAVAYEEEPVLDAEYLRNFITIAAYPFHEIFEESAQEEAPWWLFGLTPVQMIIIAVVVLLILILLIVLLIALLRRRQGNEASEEGERDAISDEFGKAIAQHAMGENVDVSLPPETREVVLKKQIRMFSDQNPEVTAQLIRTLLKEEGSRNG